jgi:hypothetical protein
MQGPLSQNAMMFMVVLPHDVCYSACLPKKGSCAGALSDKTSIRNKQAAVASPSWQLICDILVLGIHELTATWLLCIGFAYIILYSLMVLQTEQDAAGPRPIQEGDLVIVYESYNSIKSLHVDPKGQFSNRFGNFAQKVRVMPL